MRSLKAAHDQPASRSKWVSVDSRSDTAWRCAASPLYSRPTGAQRIRLPLPAVGPPRISKARREATSQCVPER